MSIEFFFRLAGMLVFGSGGMWLGVYLSDLSGNSTELWASVFGLVGVLAGLVITPAISIRPVLYINRSLHEVSTRTLFSGILGLVVSLIIAGLLALPISMLPEPFSQVLPVVLAIPLTFLGVSVFVARSNEIFSIFESMSSSSIGEGAGDGPVSYRSILMDTSVIIDGRVADIARAGFIAGELLVPRFVLNELQLIADSGDNLKRQRGRRGLEVLSQLQKDTRIPVRISDVDVEGATGVDDKLVILARQMKAPVLTNDYNLNRVAELQGVMILNINELANAIKTVFLPGETLSVRIIQEGRESGQGVGYLDDGTMVVVQDGNKRIGAEVNTTVTKVLQTAAGRMIFARID